MQAAWFVILAAMLTAYSVLDGFDFGAGIVHLFVAKTDDERRSVLAAIGPVWDGNEVWLIASGGVLVFAFPRAYAAAFSGLYLPLMMVIWLLVLRGISIEFRSQVDNPLWRAAWDATFAFASSVMALVLGVALGNVVRGVPIGASGYFHEDLFGRGGAIDVYTALFGLFSVCVLGAHGATYLAWKTRDELSARSRVLAIRLWIAALALGAVVTLATVAAHGSFFVKFMHRPLLWVLPPIALASAGVVVVSLRRARSSGAAELRAFLASCAFVAAMLLATAGTLFPTILRSTIDDTFTLDVYNAASREDGLSRGLFIWTPAMVLAIVYFVYLFRSFRGKVAKADHHY